MKIRLSDGRVLRLLRSNEKLREGDCAHIKDVYVPKEDVGKATGWIILTTKEAYPAFIGERVSTFKSFWFARIIPHLSYLPC